MKRYKDHLVVQFSVVSFVIMALIAASLALILSQKFRSDALQALEEEAVVTSTGPLLEVLTPQDLLEPMTAARYDDFHSYVERSIVSDRTARVKLWSTDGTVIYSNDPRTLCKSRFPQAPKTNTSASWGH